MWSRASGKPAAVPLCWHQIGGCSGKAHGMQLLGFIVLAAIVLATGFGAIGAPVGF